MLVVTRRKAFTATLAGAFTGILGARKVTAQESVVELDEAPFDPSKVSIPVPTCSVLAVPGKEDEPPPFENDLDALWRSPWDIGRKPVKIGCTIVQRFIGTETQGYYLGVDGLVFQSVIYAKYGFQEYFFIGINSPLTEIAGARTLLVTGTYGGVQHNTDSQWDDPVLIASKIEVPS